jgi:hypothetical protein
MNAKITYGREEIEKLCLRETKNEFSGMHGGYHWVATMAYSRQECDVELVADEPVPTATPAPETNGSQPQPEPEIAF